MTDPLIGKKLGDYEIQTLLGRGGMARVYKGYDERLMRYAAVKVIHSDLMVADQAEYTERFRREARAIARLNHPNIVNVYQYGEHDGLYYMAMVFVEGQDLRHILQQHNIANTSMSMNDIVNVVYGIGSALDYAHSRGVIHRDVKPSNILLDTENRPILTDFGLALNASEGTLGDTFGSAHYIAPEQAVSSAKAVPQSDLYSLGVCLYEMLTGKVPFDDPSAMSVALKQLNEPPPPPRAFNPTIPIAVEKVVYKALDKDPQRRYATGLAMTRALEAAIQGQEDPTASIPPSRTTEQARKTDDVTTAMLTNAKPLPTASTALNTDSKGTVSERPSQLRRTGLEAMLDANISQVSTVKSDSSMQSPWSASAEPVETVNFGPIGASSVRRPTDTEKTPVSPLNDQRRRYIPLIVVAAIAILGLLALLSGIFKGSGSVTVTPTRGTNVAVVSSATVPLIVATQESTPEVTATATKTPTTVKATIKPSATKTATLRPSTTAPKMATAKFSTNTPRPQSTRMATRTATPTGTATVSLTANTSTPSPQTATLSSTPVLDGDLLLVYDDEQLNVINISGHSLDISQMHFVQHGNPARQFDAEDWGSVQLQFDQPDDFRNGKCYQIARNDQRGPLPAVLYNCSRAAYRLVSSPRQFWIPMSDEVNTFDVELGTSVIATCTIAEKQCMVKLPS